MASGSLIVENPDDESLPKNPKLELSQALFVLTTASRRSDKTLIDFLMSEIKQTNMAPFYEEVMVWLAGACVN